MLSFRTSTTRLASWRTIPLTLLLATATSATAQQQVDYGEVPMPRPFDLYSTEAAVLHDPKPRSNAFVGAQLFSCNGQLLVGGAHRILVFDRDENKDWKMTERIDAPKTAANPGTFGTNFSAFDDCLVAKPIMPGKQTEVFQYLKTDDGWTQLDNLPLETLPKDCLLHSEISMGGDLLLIKSNLGVEVFRFDKAKKTHRWEQTIPPPYEKEANRFGYSNATNGNQIAIASWEGSDEPERVDLYEQDNQGKWKPIEQLTVSKESNEWFGRQLLFDEETLYVGAPHWKGTAGCVYLYKRSPEGGWRQIQQLTVFPDSLGSLGNHLAIYDDTLLVGAGCEGFQGSAYAFKRNENNGLFNRVAMLASVKEPITSGFGAKVAIVDEDLFVASILKPISGHGSAGGVHCFRLPEVEEAEPSPVEETRVQKSK